MFFMKYTDQAHEWRWNLVADNGRKLADSGEGYKSEADCNHAIGLIRQGAATAEVRRRDNSKPLKYIRDPAFHSVTPAMPANALAQALLRQRRGY